jgi:hypothetical protein
MMCDGHPMTDRDAAAEESDSDGPIGAGGGTQLGKRYADEEIGIEVLCTKAGTGSLSCGGRELIVRQAQTLPSSD